MVEAINRNVKEAEAAKDLKNNIVQVQQFLTDVSATHDAGGYKEAAENAKEFSETIKLVLAFSEQEKNEKMKAIAEQSAKDLGLA
jgi:methyl-accepting chemotaxis protein